VGGLTVVAAVALGLALALIGAFVPARSAARMKPLDALRAGGAGAPERSPRWLLAGVALLLAAAAGTLATGLVESTAVGVVVLLAGTVLLLPFLVPPLLHRVSRRRRLAARTTGLAAANLARAGNRTSLTVAGLVVAVGVSVAVGALTAGALAAGDRWVGGLFIGDVVVRSPAPQPLDVAGAFSRQAGVANAVPLRFLSGEVAGETLGITVIQPPMYRASTALDLDGADRSAALDALDPATPPALIAPRQLADLLGWRPGLTVSVAGQNGPVPFTIAAVAAHTYPGGDGRESVVIGSAAAGRVLGDVATGFDALDVTRGSAPMAAVESAASAFGMQAVSVATVQDATQAAVDHSVVLLSAFAWVAVVVAMLAVVNTLMVNVRQGARELGLLRAVGLSRRRAQRLVLTQAGLLALTGTAVGIGLGCLLAVPLIHASGGPGFDPGFVFPVWSVALSVAAVVLGALAAVLVPSRRAARQSIVGAIRQA
jgi:putative ABC transport system permease protein